MQINFWGVRGSSPTPFREHLRYGGNTSCVEIRTDENQICIFDAGTGLRSFGKRLVREFGFGQIQAAVFFSHYHWDHIQGIPMFEPLYHPDNHFYFYSFPSHSYTVEEALQGQMRDPYFPVQMDAMRAQRSFHRLEQDVVQMGKTTIHARRLNHPQGCLGYRIESPAGVAVYATDNEAGHIQYDRNLRELAQNADTLILDAQYTPVEYANYRRGWGHNSWEDAVKVALQAQVKRLVLYHHDPDHNDRFIDSIAQEAQKRFPEVLAASETLEIELHAGQQRPRTRSGERRKPMTDIALPAVVEGMGDNGFSFVERTVVETLAFDGASFVLEDKPDPRRRLLLHVKLSADPNTEGLTVRLESEIVQIGEMAEGRHAVTVRFPSVASHHQPKADAHSSGNAGD